MTTSQPLSTCIWFSNNQATEAAQYYCSIFKTATIHSSNAMVTLFSIGNTQLMGLNGASANNINPPILLTVECADVATVQQIWDTMIVDGEVMMPLDTYPWSSKYGWLKDKFGLTWQITYQYNEDESHTEKLTPSLLFTNQQFGKAANAMSFYIRIFSDGNISNVVAFPNESEFTGNTMFAACFLQQQQLYFMDAPGNHAYTFNDAVSFVIHCNTQDEIDYYWNQLLVNGGTESRCGWLKDQFGIAWQIVPTQLGSLLQDTQKSTAVMNALLSMKKINLHQLLTA